jgi:hypothetical protein
MSENFKNQYEIREEKGEEKSGKSTREMLITPTNTLIYRLFLGGWCWLAKY